MQRNKSHPQTNTHALRKKYKLKSLEQTSLLSHVKNEWEFGENEQLKFE
jgi:hypothetical protein